MKGCKMNRYVSKITLKRQKKKNDRRLMPNLVHVRTHIFSMWDNVPLHLFNKQITNNPPLLFIKQKQEIKR